jgi:hypothetical protein
MFQAKSYHRNTLPEIALNRKNLRNSLEKYPWATVETIPTDFLFEKDSAIANIFR